MQEAKNQTTTTTKSSIKPFQTKKTNDKTTNKNQTELYTTCLEIFCVSLYKMKTKRNQEGINTKQNNV